MDQPGTQSWPRFIAPVRAVLERIRPPSGPFDPQGAWKHRYKVCALVPDRLGKGEHPQVYGNMILERRPAGAGRFTLEVEVSVVEWGQSGLHTRATLSCAADRLATPRRWTLQSDTTEKGEPLPGISVTETGTLENGTLVRRGQMVHKMILPRPLTSDWSLMEAVQRLPFGDFPRLAFDMLEDLDLHKPEHTLRPVAPVTVEIGEHPMRLHAFRQIGRGILPVHYWLDEQHRLLAVIGSVKGLVWVGDENA